MRLASCLLAVTLGGTSQCTPGPAGTEGSLVTGRWGAPRAELTLTDAGGSIEYDCAHGGLSSPLHADGSGRFDVAGVHMREHGGPVRLGEIPDSASARYVGRVSGGRMTLRVFVGPDTLGPFELVRGADAQLVRCL